MKISDLATLPQTSCVLPSNDPDASVDAAFTSDLLSDVMANAPENSVLLTIQAHATTVAVAIVADIKAILVCSSRAIPSDMLEAARKENVAIYLTALNQYQASVAISALLA